MIVPYNKKQGVFLLSSAGFGSGLKLVLVWLSKSGGGGRVGGWRLKMLGR